jgi:GntR family transcriptional regulator
MGVTQVIVNPDHELLLTDGIDQLVDGHGYSADMPAAARNQPPATPRYIAIAALVRDRIATDQLGPHTLLPSERELADQHGVSRMTARQALSLLESEGVVYRKPPRGTFVAEPRVRFHIGSFSEEVSRLGLSPAARLCGRTSAPDAGRSARTRTRGRGAMVNVFHRLRSVDDVSFALERRFCPRT